jgi:predicted Fe-Mo cluster-binding NifX family protein
MKDKKMKICITSEGKTPESKVDPRFGRCANFIIQDTECGGFEAFENTNIGLQGGAGIQAAQFVVSKGVKAVLTGSVGPNAQQTLTAAGIKIITDISGTVKDAVEAYRAGKTG